MKARNAFNLLVLLGLIFLVGACRGTLKRKSDAKNEKKYHIVAYVAGYRNFDFSTIDVSRLTHINYAFVNIKDGEVIFDTTKIDGKSLTPLDLDKLNELKKTNPALQILVSAGGWSWSKGFSDAALTYHSRKKFAESCVRLVQQYHLDGIDLDWEYPNQSGAGNTFRPEDVHNFTLLLQAVREALDLQTKADGTGKHYLLTIATGADKNYVQNTELGQVQQFVDFINIMTYDFYNGWHKTTGHHSNYQPSAHPELDQNSVVNAVDLHLKAGVPASKINLGIPLYGRKWEGVTPSGDQVLFQKAETVGMGIDYINFASDIDQNGYKRYWDDTAKAPYLWNAEKRIFISYEDAQSIQCKMEYLKNKGLAGVMFWEYSADRNNELQQAISKGLGE